MAKINRVHAEWSGDPKPLVIPDDMREFFDLWLSTDGYGRRRPVRRRPVVVGAAGRAERAPRPLPGLKEGFSRGQVQRIAAFIGTDPAGLRMDPIVEHCSFGYMRERAEQMAPFAGTHMQDPKGVLPQGAGARLPSRDHPGAGRALRPDGAQEAGEDCARWLETGEQRAGAPASGCRQAA